MKRFLFGFFVAVLALIVVLGVRTAMFTSIQPAVQVIRVAEPLPGAVDRLSRAIRIPTISPADSTMRDTASFRAFHEFLASSFPTVHALMRRESLVRGALLYTWPGRDTSLRPIILMGHFDVVPADSASLSRWTHPPFAGVVAGGFVWGRGAVDDKATVLGLLEAAELLANTNFRPDRTVYFVFGADEEVMGSGAAAIARTLHDRRVRAHMVVDEGGVIGEGLTPGVSRPVAVVGVAEKGYVSVELVADAPGGHSSMPPPSTAAGMIARAVTRLEDNPFPARITEATSAMFDAVGREMSFVARVVPANRWLFDPLIRGLGPTDPSVAAMLRTTTAATMLEGSPKDNVLPARARAVVNFRILPGDSVAGVIQRVHRIVDDDRIRIRALGETTEPSPISSTTDSAWMLLQRTIREIYPGVVVSPYLVAGATDARHFRDVSRNVYRFLPIRVRAEDLARAHGIDERISTKDYLQAIAFYARLLENASGS